MRILFWNVQRLGFTTPPMRREHREDLVTALVADADFADLRYVVFCEVTTSAISLLGAGKQLGRGRSPRHTHHLGYAAMQAVGVTQYPEVRLSAESIPPFADVWGQAIPGLAPDDFGDRARRYVARLDTGGDGNLYVFHANASNVAPLLVAWAARHLDAQHDGDFVLFGDLNCTPDDLATQLSTLDRSLATRSRPAVRVRPAGPDQDEPLFLGSRPLERTVSRFRLCSGGATFLRRGTAIRTLDWAVAGRRRQVAVRVVHPEFMKIVAQGIAEDDEARGGGPAAPLDVARLQSDHLPIVLELT